MTDVVIYHNPNCGTSRTVLAALRDAGREPTVVEYLKTGWTADQLRGLLAAMNARPRDILRTKGNAAAEAGLLDPPVADDALIAAMVANPALVERPIVATPKGVRLCRPADTVRELL